MTEYYSWEWLRQETNHLIENAEDNDRHLQNLRRWINEASSEASSETSPETNCETSDEIGVSQSKDRDSRTLNTSSRKNRRAERRKRQKAVSTEPIASSTVYTNVDHFPEAEFASPNSVTPAEQALDDRPNDSASDNSIHLQNTKEPAMAKKKDPYQEWLKQDFNTIFEALTLKENQKHYLRSRWLDQVLWMEGRANRARDMHYKLRLTTIVGGVIIPALVSLNFTGSGTPYLRQTITVSTFALSQIVAICAATEQFFNYGDRWRHYRRGVESLKTQGWQFFELSDSYHTFQSHDQAFVTFAAQVEQILQRDVEVYATQVTQKEEAQKDKQESSEVSTNGAQSSYEANVI